MEIVMIRLNFLIVKIYEFFHSGQQRQKYTTNKQIFPSREKLSFLISPRLRVGFFLAFVFENAYLMHEILLGLIRHGF